MWFIWFISVGCKPPVLASVQKLYPVGVYFDHMTNVVFNVGLTVFAMGYVDFNVWCSF